jgi:hypothetical protein
VYWLLQTCVLAKAIITVLKHVRIRKRGVQNAPSRTTSQPLDHFSGSTTSGQPGLVLSRSSLEHHAPKLQSCIQHYSFNITKSCGTNTSDDVYVQEVVDPAHMLVSQPRAISNTHTRVCLCPHGLAVRTNSRVPLDEISKADLVVAGNLAAHNARVRVVELLAVGDHTRLCWLRRLDAVASSCSCRWLGGCRCSAEKTNTDVDAGLH